MLDFGKDVLLSLKADNADDAPRVFRLLLARCLDVEENLPALTPVTAADALGVCYSASQAMPKRWGELVSTLYSDQLKGVQNVVLQNDEVLSTPEAMFRDMAKSFPLDLLRPLLGAVPVSYATMCSGTESPIMAMQMFSDACQEFYGKSLNFDHRFSCEIDPTKQGYIYRNFDVKLLFRDIQELGGQDAHTAWNSLETVPSADAAVAGTSCVDFSSMNGKRKAIDEGGESGDTFQGLLEWVKVHRPILVCNENVMGNGANNPWPEMQRRLEAEGYAARFASFDSKEYYIPQTRTRRYMVAINVGKGAPMVGDKKLTRAKANQVLDDWAEMVSALKRPYTATLDHFLYPDDDPIVAKARRQLESQKNERRHEVDWTRSLMRNNKAREDGNLGDQRPLTRWDDADNIHPSDDADWRWWATQPNRVKDVAEVCFLRCVAQGQDPRHKPMYVNLSQNPERNDSSKQPPGLCPCLTPNEIPLITCRGGPIVAEERLKLQGLPVDSLTFTRETQQDLSSLAGNAMSSTVVGPVLLAAWAALGKAGYRRSKARIPAGKLESEADPALLLANKRATSLVPASTPSGAVGCQVEKLCQAAARSSKLCPSESGYELKCGIAACERCGHSASAAIRGTPCGEASFTVEVRPRELPDKFESWLKATLPPHVMISGLSQDVLKQVASEKSVDSRSAEAWVACCATAFPSCGVVLQSVERCRYHWRATWRDMCDTKQRGGARLELIIGSYGAIEHADNADMVCQWRLFANSESCGVQAVRALLVKPFAVADVSLKGKELLAGTWQLRIPQEAQVALRVTGSNLGPSWESKLGLSFNDKAIASRQESGLSATAWDELTIEVVDKDRKGSLDVAGVYDRASDCGAPNGSLHVRRGKGVPLYLFREADPVKHASADRFVFATNHEKLPLGEAREHRALLAEGWRPATDAGKIQENVTAAIPGLFLPLPKNQQILLSLPGDAVTYACPQNFDTGAPATDAQLVAKVALPMEPTFNGLWSDQWKDAAQRGREGPARSLYWLRGPVSAALEKHNEWQPLPSAKAGQSLAQGSAADVIVAPKMPSVKWVVNPKTGALVPQERTQEASSFERARRACPRPLAALCKGSGEVLVAARPQICALQAATLLSNDVLPGTNKADLEMSYRIFPKGAPEPEAPDAVWITLPEDEEATPMHGRYLLERSSRGLAYLRETCGEVRMEKLYEEQWQVTGPKGQVLMVSDGSQGKGVMPHQVQAWRLCNSKGYEGDVNHKIVVEARWQKTFTIAGNENDSMDPVVPAGWNSKFPLWPMQSRSVSWLRKIEESAVPYLQEATDNFEIASLGLRIEGKATMPTHGNRAVLADGVGFGKTAVVLARLLDKSGDIVPGELTPEGKMTSKATIVFVPPHLVGQWMEEKDKFITSKAGLVTIQIDSVRDLEQLTVQAICDADLIVCNFDILQSGKYLDRLSDLATGGARSVTHQKGRYQPAIYQEVVDNLRKVTRSMMKPSSEAGRLSAMEKSRSKNFEDLRAAEGASNMTRKLMNEQRKKRRKGIEMDLKHSSDDSLESLWDDDERPETLSGLVNMPFEFFDFRRLVCDEVSFASSMACTALSYGVRGRSQLCLTGTPGLDSTRAVAQLARTVGMVIGPDEPPPEELGKRNDKESTAAESLYHFLRLPDEGRYRRNTECAKDWLNRFCRHNEPAKAGIPVESHVRRVILSPLEQVLYSEKDRDLRGLDVTAVLRKGRGARGGQKRDLRMRAAMKDCDELQTAQEVLMYQASCNEGGGGKTTEVISRVRAERQQNLDDTLKELSSKARDLQHRHQELQRLAKGSEDDYARLVQRIDSGAQSVDSDLDDTLRKIFAHAKSNPKRNETLWKKSGKEDEEKDDDKDGGEKKQIDALEMKIKEGVNAAHGLGALLKEITNRHRTLRFFESVADGVLRPNQCARCDASGESVPRHQFVVLPCGHKGCRKAFMPKVNGEGRCAVKGCAQQNVILQDLLHVSTLIDAKEDDETVTAQGPFGSKFAAVVSQLQEVLAEDATNRALLFCQMDPLRVKLTKALEKAGIPFATLDGTPQAMHQAMQEFKSATGGQKRVLLLALDERCAGANLTAANHVFFAHPLIQNGSRSPADIETQAIGRARRFGQTRTVNVWRFLSQQTIEEKLEERNQLERHE